MTTWNSSQVIALAPDDSSLKNGQALAKVGKWQNLGTDSAAIWGECQGSGKNPYQAQIDLSEPAFKCSCPSRKFPCKHSLGLFLLYTKQPDRFSITITPPWVTEWLFKRAQTAEKKVEKQKAPLDPIAKAQRQEKREQKILAGLVDLDRWLQDLIRRGLADLPAQAYGFWDGMAARMVDAQAPGLARRLREAASITSSNPDWAARLLTELSKIQLLVRGYPRLAELSPGLQAEVRTQIGWSMTQEELLALAAAGEAETITDRWLVLGQTITEEDNNLRAQRIWLCGRQRFAMILNFAHRQAPLDITWQSGSQVDAQIVFYPSSAPLRGIAIDAPAEQLSPEAIHIPADPCFSPALEAYHEALIQNPWLEIYPFFVQSVMPYRHNEAWWLHDGPGLVIPLQVTDRQGWAMLAVSGGSFVSLAGIWDGQKLQPLGIWVNGQYQSLEQSSL
jgi:SWIM zinc finger